MAGPWQANLEVVRQRFPVVAERVQADRTRGWMPEWTAGQGERLADLWLEKRRIRERAFLAISGIGDGAHIRRLLGLGLRKLTLFVAEKSPADLRAAMERQDLRDILADRRVQLGVGEADERFFSVLQSVPMLEVADTEPWLFSPLFNRAPEYYAGFFAEFARQIDFRRKLAGTRVADAALWQRTTFRNLALLADAPDVAVLRDAFRGMPLILVSAGPSLDESLDFLRTASRVAIIAAVNSSYRAIRNAGIVPHLVLAADPREFTAHGFRGVPVDGTWLVTTYIVNDEVSRLFRGRVFTWSGGNELVTELRRRIGMPKGTTLVEQGTVSACAVDLALVMGCDRVCLVGQDLAIRPDGRSHAEDSFYTDLGANKLDVGACRRLPGNTLPEVLVEEKLFTYLRTFEQLVVYRPQLKFLNTSRLGARIAGIPYAAFDEALRWLGNGKGGRAQGVLQARHVAGGRQTLGADALVATLAPIRDFAREVLRLALKAAAMVEALPESRLTADGATEPDIVAALAQVDQLRVFLDGNPDNYAVLESGLTRLELFRTNEFAARLPATLPDHGRRILEGREFAWALAEGAWFLLNCVDECVDNLLVPAAL